MKTTIQTHHALSGLISGLLLLAAGTLTLKADVIAPAGLNPGDQFRIVFVTSTTRDSTSVNMADYDAFVTAAATAGGLTTYLGLPVTWQAIASAGLFSLGGPGTHANSRITTSSPALFLPTGLKVADSGADLWDGSIDAPLNVNEFGTTVSALSVWTGSYSNGAGIDTQFGELGSPNEYGHGTGSTGITTAGWIAGPRSSATNSHSFYGVSQVLTVPEPTSALLLVGSGAMLLLRRRRALI